ncbi:MAG: hypothetical protein JOY67_19865 [Hyphomicrobiales bacterium]|nr:hypothetical protein [Hyphomicrobiales bacterium]
MLDGFSKIDPITEAMWFWSGGRPVAEVSIDRGGARSGRRLRPVEPPRGVLRSLLWKPSRVMAALSAVAIITVVLCSFGRTEFLNFQF